MKAVVLTVLAAGLLVLAALTWGSVGSAVCVYCLITLGASLLYQRFLTHRDGDKFETE